MSTPMERIRETVDRTADNKPPHPYPKKFSPKHKQVVALKAAGHTNQEISEIVGLGPARVSIILQDPRGQYMLEKLTGEFIRELTESTKEYIQSHSHDMARIIAGLARHADSEQVQYRAASDLLDRAGFKAREVSVQATVDIGRADIEELSRRLEESFQDEEDLEFVEDSSGVFRQTGNRLTEPPEERLEELEEDLEDMGFSGSSEAGTEGIVESRPAEGGADGGGQDA